MAIQDEIPQSRITLTYRTTINGEDETINLPFRMLVVGDFSHGSSKDRTVDLEQRRLRSINGKNLDELMRDMDMSLDVRVPNRINPEQEDLDVRLPVASLRAFTPDEVAKNIPAVRALLNLKTLLLEMLSNIDNRREVRKLIYELFSQPEALQSVLRRLEKFEGLRLPAPAANAASAASAASSDGGAAGANDQAQER